jgi:hypothetical protein
MSEDFKQRAREAAERFAVDHCNRVCPACAVDSAWPVDAETFFVGAQWGRADAQAEIEALKKERDELKWEYENVCKFANQYEAQLAECREALESVRLAAKNGSLQGCYSWAQGILARAPAGSLRAREAELAVIQEARDGLHSERMEALLENLDAAKGSK